MYRQHFFTTFISSIIRQRCPTQIICRHFANNQLEISSKLQTKIENRLKNLIVEVDLGRGPVRSNDDIVDNVNVLEETIVKASNIDQIRELIRYNYRQFDANHIAQLFESIDNIVKYSTDPDTIRLDILGSKEFEILANRTLKIVRHLEASEALNTLIVLNNLGVSIDTVLNQALMQMVRAWINDYSIDDLYRLVRFLKQRESYKSRHSLMQALHLALPYALKHRIQYKELDFFHARTLMKSVEMIAHFGIDIFGDIDLVEKCLHYLYKQLDRLGPREWLNILSFIYAMNIPGDESSSLISRTIRLMIDGCIVRIRNSSDKTFEELPSHFFLNVLMKIDRSTPVYYDKHLFDLIAEQASSRPEKFGLRNLYLLSWKLGQFKYINHRMLRFFVEQIDNGTNSDLLSSNSSISLVNLFHLIAQSSNYHEEVHSDFTQLANKIIESDRFIEETARSKMNYFNFLRSCLILKARLDEDIIVEWFGSEYFNKALDILQSQSKRLEIFSLHFSNEFLYFFYK